MHRLGSLEESLKLGRSLSEKIKGKVGLACDTSNASLKYLHIIIGSLMNYGNTPVYLGQVPYPIAEHVMTRLGLSGLVYVENMNGKIYAYISDDRGNEVRISDDGLVEGMSESRGYDEYLTGLHDYRSSLITTSDKKPLKIIIDSGHGTGYILYKILKDEIKFIHAKPGNPLSFYSEERISSLRNAVRSFEADLGVLFDGSCRRMMLLDKDGEVITPERLAYLLEEYWFVHDGSMINIRDKIKRDDDIIKETRVLSGVGVIKEFEYLFNGRHDTFRLLVEVINRIKESDWTGEKVYRVGYLNRSDFKPYPEEEQNKVEILEDADEYVFRYLTEEGSMLVAHGKSKDKLREKIEKYITPG